MEKWRFLPLEVRDGYWNMALDEAILKTVIERKSENTLRFYKWFPSTVSIGRNQSLANEVNIKFAEKNNINVVRRITGGGAVFHDNKGEITYSIICPIKFLENLNATDVLKQFEILESGIVAGLAFFGLNTEKGIIHCPALFLDGKKFSGNAQVRRKGFILQHGTILLGIDPDLMYSVLTPPPMVSKSKMVQSVRAKCIGLKEYLHNYDENKFITSLKQGFEKVLGIQLKTGNYSEYELDFAQKLVNEKYSNKDWLYKYA
jgi:lipoate-protein ligase A